MFAFRSAGARAQHVIHHFPTDSSVLNNVAKVFAKNNVPFNMAAMKANKEKYLAECKAAEKVPEGLKVLPNGRISLKNNYFGRGYLDQNRGPLTGQTVHEIHEAIRRTPEPLEGFQLTGPYYLAQIMDHKEVRNLSFF